MAGAAVSERVTSMPKHQSPRAERGLRIAELRAKLGNCAESTIYKHMALGMLPRPRKLNGISLWLESDVDKFLRGLRQAAPLPRAARASPPAPARPRGRQRRRDMRAET